MDLRAGKPQRCWTQGGIRVLRRPRILVVGSFMMDLIASTERAPREGETVIGLGFKTAPGGKGANQAVQCARLGAEVTMVGRVGADAFGKQLVDAVQAAGVDASHVGFDENEPSGVGHITLEVSEHDARNRIIVCPGANFAMKREHIAWLRDEICHYDAVMMQLELPMDIVETTAKWAKDAGVPVMLNPAPAAELSDQLLSCVTWLSPNEHEAAVLTGHSINVSGGVDFSDIQEVADMLQARGVKRLIITLGENGAVLVEGRDICHAESVHMPHVTDTTAAGDSFVAAFCTGISAGIEQKTALDFACCAAAIAVTRMGAIPSLPSISEVQSLLARKGPIDLDPSCLEALKT